MRRVLIGCSVLFLLAVIVGSVAFYRGFYKPMQENRPDMMLISSLQTYNIQIRNKAAYTPPPDDLISPDQLHRFILVQREIRSAADTSLVKVRDRMTAMDSTMRKEPTKYVFNPGRMMSNFKGLGGDMVQVKIAQVQALNDQNFSLQEYRWVRGSILRALGRSSASTFAAFTGEVERSDSLSAIRGDAGRGVRSERRVPPENVALVQSVADSLKDWLPVSVLGW